MNTRWFTRWFTFALDRISPAEPKPEVFWTLAPSGRFYVGVMTGAYLITIGAKVAPARW
jgi:hypothetical protein